MRRFVILLMLSAAASISALAQTNSKSIRYLQGENSTGAPQCRANQLSLKHLSDDAAMGGVRLIDYSYTNTSSTACTLMGYPRFETLNRAGRMLKRGRAVNRDEILGFEMGAPKLVTIEPGKTGWFRIHFNAGGAGYTGKPCPDSYRVRVTAPGTTRAKVFREVVTHCGRIEISPVLSGAPE